MSSPSSSSSLCNLCQSIFLSSSLESSGLKPRETSFDWYPTYSAFKYSAENGCRLCADLLYEVTTLKWPRPDVWDSITSIKYRLGCFDSNVYHPWMSSDGNPTFKWQLSFSAATPSRGFIFGIHFFCAPYNAKLSSYAPLVRSPIIRTTGVDFSSARRWLTQCLEDHKMCTSTHDHQAVLPSRLIKVWQENKLIRARLVEKEEIQTGCQYVTLSYRWVRGETFLLQGNCLSDLKREIPISQLPRRFLEALEIVLHLGYSYLWLDAICVLQDSPSDWEHEASRMADVYENAVFNIAATAPDVTHSSFFPSNFTKNRKPLTVPVKIQVTDGCLVGVYSIVQNDFWRVRVDEAPLNRRAWVLQERFFSPRILYLGSDQLLWECQELQASDAFATGIPQGMYNIRAMGYRPYRTIMKTYPDLAHEITKHTWYQIIRDYTCSDLTFPSDKLFAIAGIIKKFEVILYDKCIAGLWKKTFIQDLLWCRGFLVKDFPRPIDDRAPTWSWACLDCEIYFPIHFLKLEVMATLTLFEFSARTLGGIRLRAPIIRAQCRAPSLDHWQSPTHFQLKKHRFKVRVSIDDPQGDYEGLYVTPGEEHLTFTGENNLDMHDATHKIIWIYALFVTSKTPIAGLILKRSPRKGCYCRIGYFDTFFKPTDPGAHDINSLGEYLEDSFDIADQGFDEYHGGGTYSVTVV